MAVEVRSRSGGGKGWEWEGGVWVEECAAIAGLSFDLGLKKRGGHSGEEEWRGWGLVMVMGREFPNIWGRALV